VAHCSQNRHIRQHGCPLNRLSRCRLDAGMAEMVCGNGRNGVLGWGTCVRTRESGLQWLKPPDCKDSMSRLKPRPTNPPSCHRRGVRRCSGSCGFSVLATRAQEIRLGEIERILLAGLGRQAERTSLFDALGYKVAAADFDLNSDGWPDPSAANDLPADPGAIGQRTHSKRIVQNAVTIADDHGMPSGISEALRDRRHVGHVLQLASRKFICQRECPESRLCSRSKQVDDHCRNAFVGMRVDKKKFL